MHAFPPNMHAFPRDMHVDMHVMTCHFPSTTANDIGDVCEMDTDDDGIFDDIDSDGDKFVDSADNAPFNSKIHRTDFNKHLSVSISPNSRRAPLWKIKSNVSSSHTVLRAAAGG